MTSSVRAESEAARRWLDWQRRRHLSRRDYAEYQYQSAKGRLADILRRTGQSRPQVLDVGCGLGGMSAAYASEGGVVTAVDEQLYDAESIRFARSFAASKGVSVSYLAVSEENWPFADDAFDLVFLDSVLEHASRPERLLEQSGRVLRPGGWMYISFPVFYGPFGGHIDDYIRLPWFHLLPRRIVCAALGRCRPRGAYMTPRLVEGMYLSLNRLSFRRFRRLLERAPLDIVELSRSAFLTTAGNQLVHDLRAAMTKGGWREVWASLGRARRDFTIGSFCLFLMLLPTLPLMRIDYVQELFLGGIRATLRKKGGAGIS